jgi:RNA polymerase sigma-70 factor, ECF subfamily
MLHSEARLQGISAVGHPILRLAASDLQLALTVMTIRRSLVLAETAGENWHASRSFLLERTRRVELTPAVVATMSDSPPQEITELLFAWRSGDQTALNQLMPLVYQELRRLANYLIHDERQGHLLQTTALVNEAYLRLIDSSRVQWESRAHFFAVAGQLMRRVLVDAARERQSRKRGGEWVQVSLAEAVVIPKQRSADLIALDDALDVLATMDRRKSEIVVMRFFGGLTVEETATVLNVSPETVMRDWQLAKVWLYRELEK